MTKQIVHIEDEVDSRCLVIALLSQHGYEVIGAASGESGLEAIKAHKPDIRAIAKSFDNRRRTADG